MLVGKRRTQIEGYGLEMTIGTPFERQTDMFETDEPDFKFLTSFTQRQTQLPLIVDRLDPVFFHVKIQAVEQVVISHVPVEPKRVTPEFKAFQGLVEFQAGHEGTVLSAALELGLVTGKIQAIQKRPVHSPAAQPVAALEAAIVNPGRV